MNKEKKNSIIAISIITFIILFALSSSFVVAKILNSKQNSENKAIETQQIDNSIQQYMDNMQHTVKANWEPKANTENPIRVVIKYRIHKNGEISNIEVLKSSGDKTMDETAIEAVKKSSPLAELPDALPKNYVDVNFSFDYNIYRGSVNK